MLKVLVRKGDGPADQRLQKKTWASGEEHAHGDAGGVRGRCRMASRMDETLGYDCNVECTISTLSARRTGADLKKSDGRIRPIACIEASAKLSDCCITDPELHNLRRVLPDTLTPRANLHGLKLQGDVAAGARLPRRSSRVRPHECVQIRGMHPCVESGKVLRTRLSGLLPYAWRDYRPMLRRMDAPERVSCLAMLCALVNAGMRGEAAPDDCQGLVKVKRCRLWRV